jgi:hypothetical protein
VVAGRAQAAVRYSRTGGQPRSHAAAYPAAATTVNGQAAITAAASSSHPVSLMVLRSSHRKMVNFSQAHGLTGAAPG